MQDRLMDIDSLQQLLRLVRTGICIFRRCHV